MYILKWIQIRSIHRQAWENSKIISAPFPVHLAGVPPPATYVQFVGIECLWLSMIGYVGVVVYDHPNFSCVLFTPLPILHTTGIRVCTLHHVTSPYHTLIVYNYYFAVCFPFIFRLATVLNYMCIHVCTYMSLEAIEKGQECMYRNEGRDGVYCFHWMDRKLLLTFMYMCILANVTREEGALEG